MFALNLYHFGLLLLIACTILVYCNGDQMDAAAGTQKRPSFFVGSRYGRSAQVYASKSRRLNVAPRNDRFFLGSRYGKRTNELVMPAYLQTDSSSMSPMNLEDNRHSLENSFMMSCIYTGVKNFYRCSDTDEINNIVNQLTNGPADEDDK